jgi:hypothetical protein
MDNINFEGVRDDSKSKTSFLIFSIVREGGKSIVEVPVENMVATRIMSYIRKIVPPYTKPVERGNQEP